MRIVVALAVVVLLPLVAAAATFNVAAGDTAGLIAAINSANAMPDADTIELAAASVYAFTAAISGQNALPGVSTPVTIHGNGSTLSRTGGPVFRFLEVLTGGALTVSNLTLTGGNTGNIGDGGAIEVTGADGALTMTGCSLVGNQAGENGRLGGALDVVGANATVTLTDCDVRGNSSAEGGGISIQGLQSTVTLTRVHVVGNSVTYSGGTEGGGISNFGVHTTVIDSEISGNSVTSENVSAQGGGIHDGGLMTITGCTISGNTVSAAGGGTGGGAGGGMDEAGGGPLTMVNCTISGNTATNSSGTSIGGGLAFLGSQGTLNNLTISQNSASTGGGISPGTQNVTLANSLVVNNDASVSGIECDGPITSLGHNMLLYPAGCGLTAGPGDILGTDPTLGGLADNGGPTLTREPADDAGAVDAGDPSPPGSGGSACAATDQRGAPRPVGAACDIGAFEFGGVVPTPTTTSTTLPGSAVAAFVLPKRVVVKPNTKTPARSRLTTAGIFDTGPNAVDLSGAATLDVGGASASVSGLTPKGRAFVLKQQGFIFAVTPARTGSSKATFKMKLQEDLTGKVASDGPLTIHFADAAVDGTGTVTLTGGKYALGKKPGALVAPTLFTISARARIAGGGRDALALRVGLATTGATPASAPDLTVDVGTFHAAAPSGAFTRTGTRFTLTAPTGGLTAAALDYQRETLTIKAKGVDLGTFADGPQPVTITVSLGTTARANAVRMVKKGKALRY